MAAVGLPRDGTLGMGVHTALGGAQQWQGPWPGQELTPAEFGAWLGDYSGKSLLERE